MTKGIPRSVPPSFYRLIEDVRGNRVRCGRCLRHLPTIASWRVHFLQRHGTYEELELALTPTQRGFPPMKPGTFGGDRRKQWRHMYAHDRKRRIRYVREWYRAHPEAARRIELRKLSKAPGARQTRRMEAKLRHLSATCGECGRPIVRKQIAGSWITFCRWHGTGWQWRSSELAEIVLDGVSRSARTRRGAIAHATVLRAWATRRARGDVGAITRKAWATRRERYGPAGMTRSRTGRLLWPPEDLDVAPPPPVLKEKER